MRARRPVALASAVLVAAAALALVTALRPRPLQSAPAGAPVDPSALALALTPADFAPSLRGTTPDGPARAAAGALVLDPSLIRLFDYYLSTVGERSLADIRTQAERELDRRMNPLAARQAKDILGRYLGFKHALLALAPAPTASGGSAAILGERFRAMHDLRSQYFSGAECVALFGPDDAEAADALARMAIEQDASLDAAQKRLRTAALDAALPAEVRASREAPLAITRLQEAAQRLREQGGSEDDVYRMRAAAASPEAANRLADLDRDEANWRSRIAAYVSGRNAVLAAPGTDEQRQQAIGELRERMFTPDEQRRLAAYEG